MQSVICRTRSANISAPSPHGNVGPTTSDSLYSFFGVKSAPCAAMLAKPSTATTAATQPPLKITLFFMLLLLSGTLPYPRFCKTTINQSITAKLHQTAHESAFCQFSRNRFSAAPPQTEP